MTSMRGDPFRGGGQGGGRQPQAAAPSALKIVGEVSIERGRVVYSEGEKATSPYLVASGVLRVSVDALGGRSRLVDLVGAGDILGTAALEDEFHAETVTATEVGARLLVIDLAATLASREGRTQLTSGLVRQLVRSRELADDLGLPMGARICRILARLAERLGETVSSTGDGLDDRQFADPEMSQWRHLPFSLTHDDVALLAGCARVTATRILGDLKEAGVLDGSRGDYALVPSALQDAADKYVCEVI
jgi:CRP-like cAMP-binding protein